LNKKPYILIFLFTALFCSNVKAINNPKGEFTISGYITDQSNGEYLPGATVYISELKKGTVSNIYGYYSISLKPSAYKLIYSYLGYSDIAIEIDLMSDTSINIELIPSAKNLDEVEITDKAVNENITSTQMSVNKIDSKTIKSVPALLGEVDLVRALQLLPGVKFAAEGSSGFSVRGGSPDQNLILLDEANVYNAGHLLGFFSVFNNDAVKSVELFKGDLPAKYGGRLASLVDIRMKDGNSKQFHGNGGIGIISSRLMLEGPIVKDRASFMVAGRRSYADLFLIFSNDPDLKGNKLYFYDLNGKVNFRINQKNQLFLSGYYGKDVFKNDFFKMNWGNATGTLRWNHIFDEKLFSNFTFVYNKFNYNIGFNDDSPLAFLWQSSLTDYNMKADFTWFASPNNKLSFGFSSMLHDFFPGTIEGQNEESFITSYLLPDNYALESAVYISNEQNIGTRITLKYGLRLSVFNNIGPATSFSYNAEGDVIDSTNYSRGDFYKTYWGLEPRVGIVYQLNEVSSLKASYSRNYQYIQQAQNSVAGSPLNIWFPASPNVKPQIGDQVALGYFRNFKEGNFETSAEMYYKSITNAVDFRDFAELLLNKYLEGELLFGNGWSYGIELMVKKNLGKLTGWMSYTWSRAFRQIDGINNNEPYSSSYDRPNDFSIALNYDLNQRISFGFTWIYLTGQPVTFPVGRYEYGNTNVPIYSDRNSYRLADYHRMDVSFTWKDKPNPNKRWHNEFNISIYNAYNRKNPWVINFQTDINDPSVTYAEMTYLFGIIPAFTWNFKF
jgi:hypothetical protein